MNVKSIIDRVSKYDTNLAKEISGYLNSRKYGLVYEESKPEFVSLPNKEVVRGDLVNILPPRKTLKEETKGKNNKDKNRKNKDKKKAEKEEAENRKYKLKWRVVSLDKKNNKATLVSLEKDQETVTVNYDDLVAISRFDQPIYTGLKEVDRIERGGDKPFNTVINGENFHALETLMYAYYGKIDCIYIDPPYNSGATDWKYNNNYVGKEDSYRHSKWLTFMADRLKLARKLLNPSTGVLVVTIDEHEMHRLRMLVEQLFPNAFIQMATDVINPKGVTQNYLSRVEEYVLFVFMPNAKMSRWHDNMLNDETEPKSKKKVQWASLLRRGNNSQRVERPNSFYPILVDPKKGRVVKAGQTLPLGEHPDLDKKIDGYDAAWPIRTDLSEGHWSMNSGTLNKMIAKGFVSLGRYDKKRHTWAIKYLYQKQRLQIKSGEIKITGFNKEANHVEVEYDAEKDINKNVKTVWKRRSHDGGTYGSSLLLDIFKDKRFTFPKSLYSVYDEIGMIVADKPDALILDFFAGSATTIHATALLNSVDGGHRRCICITNNEVGSAYETSLAQKGLRPGDSEWEKYGIAHYVAWPRVKSIISGKDIKGSPLEGKYGVDNTIYVPVPKEKIPHDLKLGRKKLYSSEHKPIYPELSEKVKADGFEENAVFFDLKYLEPSIIKADLAFDEIAPLLWMKAGSKDRIIKHKSDYDITNEYAVLFNYKYVGIFTRLLKQRPEVKTIFIITDVNSRYQDFCHEFSDRNVYKLYESYLKSFKIQSLN